MSDSGAIQETLQGDPRMAAVYRWVENNLDLKKEWQAWPPGLDKMRADGFLPRPHGSAGNAVLLFPSREEEFGYVARADSNDRERPVFGSFTAAAVQGVLGGLMFWFLRQPRRLSCSPRKAVS